MNQELLKKRWQPNLIETLIVLAIIAILVALLIPPTKWASSGSIVLPVRVFVFDSVSGKPLKGVSVGIRHRSGVSSSENSKDDLVRWPAEEQRSLIFTETTNEQGIVVIEHEFHTGASYRRPESYTHLTGVWVVMSATGYGSLTIPVSNTSRETAKIREQGEIFVPIGLVPLSIEDSAN